MLQDEVSAAKDVQGRMPQQASWIPATRLGAGGAAEGRLREHQKGGDAGLLMGLLVGTSVHRSMAEQEAFVSLLENLCSYGSHAIT